jgi:hypothetical protein
MALRHAASTLRTASLIRDQVAAATPLKQFCCTALLWLHELPGEAKSSCRPQASAFSTTVEHPPDVSGIKRCSGLLASRDMLPRYGDDDVKVGESTYSTPERHRKESHGSVGGRAALVKTVSLAADPDAAVHVMAEVKPYSLLGATVVLSPLQCCNCRLQAVA